LIPSIKHVNFASADKRNCNKYHSALKAFQIFVFEQEEIREFATITSNLFLVPFKFFPKGTKERIEC